MINQEYRAINDKSLNFCYTEPLIKEVMKLSLFNFVLLAKCSSLSTPKINFVFHSSVMINFGIFSSFLF